MSTTSSSTSALDDPRRPDRIVEYKPEVKRIEDDDPDVPGFIALVLAVVGLMIRASDAMQNRRDIFNAPCSPQITDLSRK
ncbi:hypothetical protein BG011_001238 [Mortierella polycephala]|uniref:Uncharacterized protein n=1 Tax=Mortierella polycephala TaxID=41804 RepID=A0A9P6PLK2_9FUNG|nr:hypothetical protein BG011_001238 [Mortierella polycephala]